MNTTLDQTVAEFVNAVAQQLNYEVNALVNLVNNGKVHPSYAPQAMIRQQGYALKGAVSLAVRLCGSVHRSVPNDLLASANRVADQAITFKR